MFAELARRHAFYALEYSREVVHVAKANERRDILYAGIACFKQLERFFNAPLVDICRNREFRLAVEHGRKIVRAYVYRRRDFWQMDVRAKMRVDVVQCLAHHRRVFDKRMLRYELAILHDAVFLKFAELFNAVLVLYHIDYLDVVVIDGNGYQGLQKLDNSNCRFFVALFLFVRVFLF